MLEVHAVATARVAVALTPWVAATGRNRRNTTVRPAPVAINCQVADVSAILSRFDLFHWNIAPITPPSIITAMDSVHCFATTFSIPKRQLWAGCRTVELLLGWPARTATAAATPRSDKAQNIKRQLWQNNEKKKGNAVRIVTRNTAR